MEEEEEEPKIYINNRTNSWAVVGRVGGVVTVLTKEDPSVESKVVPDWVKDAMKGEEEEEGEEETPKAPLTESAPVSKVSKRKGMMQSMQKFIGQSSVSKAF